MTSGFPYFIWVYIITLHIIFIRTKTGGRQRPVHTVWTWHNRHSFPNICINLNHTEEINLTQSLSLTIAVIFKQIPTSELSTAYEPNKPVYKSKFRPCLVSSLYYNCTDVQLHVIA